MTTKRITQEAQLQSIAEELISVLPQKDSAHIVALHGDLGAGKTTFVQTLARELGVQETITSPTFVIMKHYGVEDGPTHIDRLIHIDAYRIEDIKEMEVLGWANLIRQPDTLICIEWAEKLGDLIPSDHISYHFTLTDAEGERSIEIKGY